MSNALVSKSCDGCDYMVLLEHCFWGGGSYATRVRSIINEASKNMTTKEIVRLKKQISYWKDQAGKPGGPDELEDVTDERTKAAE